MCPNSERIQRLKCGSVRQIIDCQANVVKLYTYNPFGELIEKEPSDEGQAPTNCFKFTGQYYDSEISQYYLRARQYDPHLSRFTSRDSILGDFKEPITLHRYLYCGNDPLNRIDPFGLWAYYITGGFMMSAGVSATGQGGIVWDDKGNWGLISIQGLGGGVPSVFGGINVGITDAYDILELRGYGRSAGASLGYGFASAGLDYIWGTSETGRRYSGIQINVGVGYSPLSELPDNPIGNLEFHGHQTYTSILPLGSESLTFERIVGQAAGEAFYQSQTIGEATLMLHFMHITDIDYLSALQ